MQFKEHGKNTAEKKTRDIANIKWINIHVIEAAGGEESEISAEKNFLIKGG